MLTYRDGEAEELTTSQPKREDKWIERREDYALRFVPLSYRRWRRIALLGRLVLSLGPANSRSMLALERVGINVLDFPIPDNDGPQPTDEPILEGSPAAYFATLPIKAILAAWRKAGLPGHVSNTAGTYVCNQTSYRSLHLSEEHGHRAGLTHVPCLPGQAAHAERGAPSMALGLIVRAVEVALEVSLSRSEDIVLSVGAIS
jgi:pyroglutamyl-peptidase